MSKDNLYGYAYYKSQYNLHDPYYTEECPEIGMYCTIDGCNNFQTDSLHSSWCRKHMDDWDSIQRERLNEG